MNPNLECQQRFRDFSIVMNRAIRDPRLSWRAKGILAACLNDGFSKAWVIEHGREGRDAVSRALKELRELGYLESRVERCKASGRVVGERWVLGQGAGQ
jgi:hypothetical protein